MQDIRKWFVKPHAKGNGNASNPEKSESPPGKPSPATVQLGKVVQGNHESSGRRKTSKYFSANRQKEKDETEEIPATGKSQRRNEESPAKKLQKVDDGNDDDFVLPTSRKNSVDATPRKRLKNGSGRGISQRAVDIDENDVHDLEDKDAETPPQSSRKGHGERGASVSLASGRGGPVGRRASVAAVDIDKSDEENIMDEETEIPVKSGGRGRGGRGSSAPPGGGRGSSAPPGGGRGGAVGRKASVAAVDIDEGDEENIVDKDTESPVKSGGRGRGGRGASAAPGGGRGRGGGRGGFMNFGERKDPPHKGEKEVPEGAPDCLAGFTFVISGTLDSLEREEAEDLIKRHGGRVTGSVSKKTNYLLCDEDIGGRKSAKAKELGTKFLNEDGLFDIVRASTHAKSTFHGGSKKTVDKVVAALPKTSPEKVEVKKDPIGNSSAKSLAPKALTSGASGAKRKDQNMDCALTWTEKYKPKVPNDIIGNQSLVKQLHDWLAHWNDNFLNTGKKAKGKKQNDAGTKKAVLLSGTPGIGKTTSAKLVSQMLGFQTVEVNASDSRGKADAQIQRGVGGSTANSVKELVSNEALNVKMDWSKHPKTVLIMDEVDGMSAGDRGGVADLIASIKISKVPIICICNDRYSQKLKSLVNYCLLLSFRKPTKQQMAKRLSQVANSEGLKVNEVALEELAERVNGDMRMALNQLQYMSLSKSVINYDDIRKRLLSSSKDEDISPFAAVDKLFGFNGGKLRMDERIDLSMSDPDLVPLLIQENFINYRPSLAAKDSNGIKRMNLIARAAESIGDGDIVNVQIRRYRQWQLSQTSSLTSCIIPAALLHGQREILEQGERNFNRFGGWLGKNSTMGKNMRLLEDVHYHILASCASNLGRDTLRVHYLTALLKRLTEPLRQLPKDEAVQKSIEFMNLYSIGLEDFDTIMELLKFKGHSNPMEGIETSVKTALTKAYKKSTSRIRAADLISLPGIKKAPKKRIAAMLEPADDSLKEENPDTLADSEEEDSSDTEDLGGAANGDKKLQDLQGLNSKGIQVQLDLKGTGNSSAKKTPTGRGKGVSGAAKEKGGQGRGSGVAAKRKR